MPKHRDIDDYLDRIPEDHRTALQKLRRQILAAALIEEYADELAPFDPSRGAIRFTPARPLPAALVKRLIRARLAENRQKAAVRARPSKK